IGGEKALRVPWGLESLHPSLALPCWLMGVLRAVVEIPMLTVLDSRQNLALCRSVALQLVGDAHPWHRGEAFEQLPKELLRGLLVPTTLDENVEDIAVLVNRPPEVMSFAMHRDAYLVQVPFIARARTAPTEGICIGLTKLPAPLAARFVGYDHPTDEQQFF